MTEKMIEDLYKVGLEETDIIMLKNIDNAVMKINNIAQLIIKAHNTGFKKGTEEVMKYIECEKTGNQY